MAAALPTLEAHGGVVLSQLPVQHHEQGNIAGYADTVYGISFCWVSMGFTKAWLGPAPIGVKLGRGPGQNGNGKEGAWC